VFDWQEALKQSEIDEEMLRELGALFLEEGPKLLGEIRSALAEADAPKLRRAAHTLKGSAAIFSARPVAETALEVEQHAKAGDLAAAATIVPHLEEELERLITAMSPYVTSESRTGERR